MILSTFVSSVNCSPWILSFSLSKNNLTLIQAPAWIAKEAWRRLSSQLEPQDSCPQSRSPEKWWSVAPFHTSQGHGILAPWCGRLMTRGAPTPSSTCVCVCGGGCLSIIGQSSNKFIPFHPNATEGYYELSCCDSLAGTIPGIITSTFSFPFLSQKWLCVTSLSKWINTSTQSKVPGKCQVNATLGKF